jgi:alpha-tubulin suppressor-like RCC1 family protein
MRISLAFSLHVLILNSCGLIAPFSEMVLEGSAVSAGYNHTCALVGTGDVKCWGSNDEYQLGDGTTVDHGTPTNVSSLSSMASGVIAISAGGSMTCGLGMEGGAICWGRNSPNIYVAPDTSADVSEVSVGLYHACAVMNWRGVKCWGSNGWGQLGNGTRIEFAAPVDVVDLSSGVLAVSAGGLHTCAVLAGGGVKCWGYNRYGQLGDGTTTDRTEPVDVTGFESGVSAISTGGYHTCAMMDTGGVVCWGRNTSGQIGNGSTTGTSVPVYVSGLSSGAEAVSCGGLHTCALTKAGGVKCWGENDHGQLGDGTKDMRTTRVNVIGLTSGAAAISCGGSHTCALLDSGQVQCWGDDEHGQLGDGTTEDRTAPVTVHY